jgi:hypothetical protein
MFCQEALAELERVLREHHVVREPRQTKRLRIFVAAAIACILIVGGIAWVTGWRGPWGDLTGEKAKRALLDLMDTRDSGPVSRSDAQRFADEPVKYLDSGQVTWGPFRLDLPACRYEFGVTYGSEPKMNKAAYEGTFEKRDGVWVALPPRMLWHASGVHKEK